MMTTKCCKTLLFSALLAATGLMLGGCDESDDRPEVIDSVRPIGIATTPVTAKPGDTVQVTLHVAVPRDTTVTADTYTLTQGGGQLPAPEVSTTAEPQSRTAYASLDHLTFSASFVVPAELTALVSGGKPYKLRYGLKLVTTAKDIPITDDIMVFPDGAPELAWETVGVAITSPLGSEPVAPGEKIPLAATITKPQDEPVKSGWFAGIGEIKNRRSIVTEWKAETAGTYTVIFTARAKKSLSFALDIRDVTLATP